MSIAVLGAGAFGTALALSLAANHRVMLWGRDAGAIQELQKTRRTGARLPGFDLPPNVFATADMADIPAGATVLLCVPMQQLSGLLRSLPAHLSRQVLVACSKGIDLASGHGASALISEAVPGATSAVLTGPSFALDIARGLPTALTLACADDRLGQDLQHRLSTKSLRLYRTTDVTGAELGGALKNVMAIACGAVMGAGLGQSAQAALIARGFAEMQMVAAQLGSDPKTLMGLSGFGDLVLTCTSDQSRNFRYGLALGRGEIFEAGTTVEGRHTAQAVMDLAARHDLDLPICMAVADLVSGRVNVHSAMQTLFARPLKEE